MKRNSREKYMKPIEQFPQNSNGHHYVSKPRSNSTCFGDLEQIQLLQLHLSSKEKPTTGSQDKRRKSKSQIRSREKHQKESKRKDKMDTVVKSDGKTLKPNQDIRRCSFQSGGGLVTVNFIGASKKKPKLPTNSTKSTSSPKKYNSTNNSSHLLATNNNSNNNNKPMLRRKSVAVIQSLPNTNKHQSFCGDSLGMPKEPRQRKLSASTLSPRHSAASIPTFEVIPVEKIPSVEEINVNSDTTLNVKTTLLRPTTPTKNMELRKKIIRKDKRRSSIHNLELFMT